MGKKLWDLSTPPFDNVFDLLSKYSEGLKESTNNLIRSTTELEIINNRFIYKFILHGDMSSPRFSIVLFRIELLDLSGRIVLETFYMNKSESIHILYKNLEEFLDNIISSDNMGKYIRYLMEVEKRLI